MTPIFRPTRRGLLLATGGASLLLAAPPLLRHARAAPRAITVHRGTGPDDSKSFELDPAMPLAQVRRLLTAAQFLAPDGQAQYRFVAAKSESSNLADALVATGAESLIPLSGVLRGSSTLIVSDVKRPFNSDLIGVATPHLTHRHLSVWIYLNDQDREAIQTNNAIKAFRPLMLSSVFPTNPKIKGYWEHVCVLVEGSIVTFMLRSWGAAGFDYTIMPERGEPIAPQGTSVAFDDRQNIYGISAMRTYTRSQKTIRIVGADSAGIASGDVVRFQKVTVRSRRITSYVKNGKRYASTQTPPDLAAAAPGLSISQAPMVSAAPPPTVVPVPGDAIKPGGPVRGGTSGQTWAGPITEIEVDDWSNALGQVSIYFFVFKSWEQAHKVIASYNARP